MITANVSYGKLIYIKSEDRYKYIFDYTTESQHLCCYRKGGLNST